MTLGVLKLPTQQRDYNGYYLRRTYLVIINDILRKQRERTEVVKAETKEDTNEHKNDANNARRAKNRGMEAE